MPLATPPSLSGIPAADQLSSPPSTTLKSIFGVPPSSHHPHSPSIPSMGQVASRPQLNTTLSPSSAPSSLGVSASNSGGRFKRALVGRRKKSDTVPPPSPRLDKGKEPQIDESLQASASAPPRPLGAKQLTLQLAQHVFNKKSAPASPVMSGLSLPPPPPPPKHAHQPASRLMPINTNIDKRISVMTTSSPIVPALDYLKKGDEPTEQVASKENEWKDIERSESKDVRRKSDSTLSLHTIRPSLGSKTPRPVSLVESLHSTHTIVPINKRLSALITDAEYVMAEEEDGSRNDDKGRSCSRSSPASSLRLRDRRSQSLNLGPPLSLMVSGSTVSNATMSLETISVTLPRSVSEGRERERLATREMATMTFSSLPSDATRDAVARHTNAISSLNQAYQSATTRVERTLPDLPDPPPKTTSPPQTHSPQQQSIRQTAISMTSGFAPAAGLARRAVERMGRVWGSKSSFSSPLASPLGELSSNGRTGLPSRTTSSHSESTHHGHGRRVRHHPQTPSVSSTASSVSDHEGPQLGRRIRGPVRASGVGGFVFGRELKTCVEETAIDSILSVLHAQNLGQDERGNSDTSERMQWSQPSAPLESRHVPALVVRCAQHILAWGVQEQGLFRVSGRSSHVAKLRAEFDTGADFDIVQSNPGDLDPHAVASVFKAYLRELPEPILTNQLMPYFDAAMASERLTNNIQDLPPSNDIYGLRKPPSLSTLGMPNFGGAHPPSESLRKALSTLISRLPQENRDLLFTVTEVINHTSKRSSETKMPLSNLLLVLCPSLSMNPSLLQALCESQGIWHGVQRKDGLDLDAIAGETNQSSLGFSKEGAEIEDAVGTDQIASHLGPPSESKRCVRPLPSLPTADGSTSVSSSPSTCEPLGLRISGHDVISRHPLDAETSSPSFSATDDSSSISHLSQSGRPVTPTSLNFKLTNPYSPPSLSCSTDSLSVPSSSSGSPMQLVKSLKLVDECNEQQPSNSPHSPDIAEPIPLPIPSLRPTQPPPEAQFQFPGPRDSVIRNPIMHRKSTPSISFSSSISAEARSASIASRAKRLKKPSLHLFFSKHTPSPGPTPQTPVVASPLAALQEGALRSSSTSGSSPDSMVTAPQSSRFSYPPVLNTAIDESSISLALGIQDDGEDRATSVGHATKNGMTNSQGSIGPGTPLRRSLTGESSKDDLFRHLDVTLPEEEQFGEYNWTQSVLMAAGEPRW
ncbi:RhoGAP-domain-containing protein [Imleria badia]|nr:RhoGAP-domain-containing protein [Imleria badia]